MNFETLKKRENAIITYPVTKNGRKKMVIDATKFKKEELDKMMSAVQKSLKIASVLGHSVLIDGSKSR